MRSGDDDAAAAADDYDDDGDDGDHLISINIGYTACRLCVYVMCVLHDVCLCLSKRVFGLCLSMFLFVVYLGRETLSNEQPKTQQKKTTLQMSCFEGT